MDTLRRVASLLGAAILTLAGQEPKPPAAHFHHVHLNSTDPEAAIRFYTRTFDYESGLLFSKTASAPPHQITSPIWHIGWGAEDMPGTYKKQLDAGTKFETPLTDISALVGMAPNSGKFFYAYVDGPDHALIELNTASHHRFGHLHLLSKDPIAAAEWYEKHLGIPIRGKNPSERLYEGFPVAPSASLQADNINIIIFPMAYAKKQWPELWKNRDDFESSQGRVMDHVGFRVADLDQAVKRLRAAGVKILAEPRSLGDLHLKSALIEGPDHISIELVEGEATKP